MTRIFHDSAFQLFIKLPLTFQLPLSTTWKNQYLIGLMACNKVYKHEVCIAWSQFVTSNHLT